MSGEPPQNVPWADAARSALRPFALVRKGIGGSVNVEQGGAKALFDFFIPMGERLDRAIAVIKSGRVIPTEFILKVAIAEYQRDDIPLYGEEEYAAHRSAIRSMMVRFGLYDEFVKRVR